MANIELGYDQVYYEDIRVANNQGIFEPVPSGDTFSAASSDAANVGAAVAANPKTGNPAVQVTPLHSSGPYQNVSITVSDTSGLTPWALMFDVIPNPTPVQIVGDPNSVDIVTQPLPPA